MYIQEEAMISRKLDGSTHFSYASCVSMFISLVSSPARFIRGNNLVRKPLAANASLSSAITCTRFHAINYHHDFENCHVGRLHYPSMFRNLIFGNLNVSEAGVGHFRRFKRPAESEFVNRIF